MLGNFLTKWLKDTKQIKTFKMLQSYIAFNLKTKTEKYIPLPSHISQVYSKKERIELHIVFYEIIVLLIGTL